MQYSSETIVMTDGAENVLHSWLPEGDVQALVLLSHGMAEHASRYEGFASVLAENGMALFAEDHRGHGETAFRAEKAGKGKFGYLADKKGFFRVADDIHEEALLLRRRFPGKKLFLFGHSFGSLVSQCVMERYGGDFDGVVLCGTAGPRRAEVAFARTLSLLLGICGRRRVLPLMDVLVFGSYNARIDSPRTPVDWVSSDPAAVDAYVADPWCGFTCTVGFFQDMFSGLGFIHAPQNLARIPHKLPVLLIAGKEDPVGSYGRTVEALANVYRAGGMEDVQLKLYDGDRHELLNERDRAQVQADVLAWLHSHA
ncbi:MAG: lysophospholipase [Treponema sp.]|nr:lysophospholipase [Treponema sp.]